MPRNIISKSHKIWSSRRLTSSDWALICALILLILAISFVEFRIRSWHAF